MNVILYLFYPFLVIFTLAYIYRKTSIKETIKKHWKIILLFFLCNIVFLNIYGYFRFQAEDFIPYWDHAGYYKKILELLSSISYNDFPTILHNIYESMLYNDYSYFAASFLLLPMHILGISYPRYLISVLNFFIIPTNLLLFVFLLNQFKLDRKLTVITSLAILLFTSNLAPTFYGYISSVGMFFITAIIILTFSRSHENVDILSDVIIGLLLLLIVLIRRWYAYFVVAYFISALFSEIIQAINEKKLSINRLKIILMNLFISGITASVILGVWFIPVVRTYLTNDYSSSYSAYALTDEFQYIIRFYNHYAPYTIWIILIGVGYDFIHRQNLKLTSFCLISTSIIFIMFTRIQQIDTHHYYLMNIAMLILLINGIKNLVYIIKNPRIIKTVLISICFLIVVNFYCCFSTNNLDEKSAVTFFSRTLISLSVF